MSKRKHDCQCRATRGILRKHCRDCGIDIGQVMYDRCSQCEWNHAGRPRDPSADLVYRPARPWYGLIRSV